MKRGKKMILMLCALAILLGGYYGIQQLNKTESVSETSGSFELTARTIEDLTGLSWTAGDTTYSFTYSNDTWTTNDQPEWPVLQSAVQTMADTLVELQGTRKLEDVTSLADYGLETPAFSVTASWSDGTQTTYSMGDATPFADGYYLSLSGEESTIYTIASSLETTFDKTQKDLVAMETIPSVSEVERLSVGSTLDVSMRETSATVDPDQLWYETGTDTPLDGDQIETLIADAQAIAWDDLATANADAESLSEWQLDDEQAVTITLSGGEESASIMIGAQNEDGNYYARLPDSSMAYTVTGDAVDSLLNASAENLWIKTVLPLPYAQLASATLSTEKGEYQITKPAEDAAEQTEAAETEEAEEDEAVNADENLWQMVTELTATGRLNAEPAGDQMLRIDAASTSGVETSVVFYEYSAESYLAVVDGGTPLMVPADDIDALVRTVRTMLQNNP